MTSHTGVGYAGDQSSPPKENILRIWKAVESRSQMRQRRHHLEFVEYIWLKRLCHHFDVLGFDESNHPTKRVVSATESVHGSDMEEFMNVAIEAGQESDSGSSTSTSVSDSEGSGASSSKPKNKSPLKYMSVFSFLDAIRLHRHVPEIERHRKGPPSRQPRSPRVKVVESSLPPKSKSPTPEVFQSEPRSQNGSDSTDSRTPNTVVCDTPTIDDQVLPVIEPKLNSSSSKLFVQPTESTSSSSSTSNAYNFFSEDNNASASTSAIKALPKYGTSPPSEYTYSYSYADALKYAIMYGHLEYTLFLLEHHLEESLLETVCCPLLLVAVRLGHPDIVEQLCSHSRRKCTHNFYINKPGCSAMEGGRTALHVAAEMGSVPILSILLTYGADVTVRDDHGQTPLRRVLYRLQSPHITNRTIRCIWQLLKCQPVVTAKELDALSRILLESAPTITEADKPMISQLIALVPGPLSLKHICRVVIRRVLYYPFLPEGLNDLNLPNSLKEFLKLKCC